MIEQTHDGVKITYNESRNVWEFELRGRCRSAESLAKAKEAIDKPVPEKTKPFERFDAWFNSYGEWLRATVTSISESNSWNQQVWISLPKTETNRKERRLKTTPENLYPCGPKNDSILKKIQECDERSRIARKESEDLRLKMTVYELPPEEE